MRLTSDVVTDSGHVCNGLLVDGRDDRMGKLRYRDEDVEWGKVPSLQLRQDGQMLEGMRPFLCYS